jgi:D-proline reductase (dithiol) PrdB
VGLIQRKIEEHGIPTVSISVAKDVTAAVKVPRAVFVPWPMGHHFGAPFHTEIQRKVILAALDAVQMIEQSGTVIELAIPWAEVRRQSKTLSEQGKRL